MLEKQCSIACKMDTQDHFIRGLNKEREDSRRVFSSLPVLPASGAEPITGTIRHKHADQRDLQFRAEIPPSPPVFPGPRGVWKESGSVSRLPQNTEKKDHQVGISACRDTWTGLGLKPHWDDRAGSYSEKKDVIRYTSGVNRRKEKKLFFVTDFSLRKGLISAWWGFCSLNTHTRKLSLVLSCLNETFN